MNTDTMWPLVVAGATIVFILAVFKMQTPEKPVAKSVDTQPKKGKNTAPASKAKEKKSSSAPEKPAAKAVTKKTEPVSKPAPAPEPIPSPTKLSAEAPDTTSSGNEMKLKKPKETAAQKEARLKRQEAAKLLKKESETTARTLPEISAAPKKTASLDDEWEVVVDKKKDRTKKKLAEVVAPVPEPKPKAPVVVKETKSVVIDSKRVGSVIGPKGVTLRQVQDLTETEIQIPRSDPDRSAPTVSISVIGQAGGVAKAIKILKEISDTGTSYTLLGIDPNPPAPVVAIQSSIPVESAPTPPKPDVSTYAVKVESKRMGAIIGPKGSTLHAIQDATGTEINTTTAPKAEVTSVVITGPEAGVAKASKAVNELAAKGYCMLLSGEGFQESHIHVPPRFLSEIIGKSGATIRAIQDNTGARVVIPPSAPRPGDRNSDSEAPVKVTLAGPKDGVTQAKQIITQITELYYHPVTHPGVVHVTLDVPEKYFNFIIGTKGSEIRHIQNNFKVSVKIPDRNTVFQSVLVIGEISNCDSAVRYINKLITQVDEREQERSEDQKLDDDESYDEELMNRYVYSRQQKNKSEEPEPVVVSADPSSQDTATRTRPISDRPPGFSPLGKGEAPDNADHGAVPLNWGPVKSTLTW